MVNQFYFKNFVADEIIKHEANMALGRILDRAPYDSSAIALLEAEEDGFRCSLDIYSRQGPFMACTVRPTAKEAVHAAMKKIENQIAEWWSSRKKQMDSRDLGILESVS